jgi:hypothetical protein
MSKQFLCIGEPYESNGEKKVSWHRIGEMFIAKNGKQYVKLYHIPGALINVFEDEKKNASASAKAPVKQSEYGPLAPDESLPF